MADEAPAPTSAPRRPDLPLPPPPASPLTFPFPSPPPARHVAREAARCAGAGPEAAGGSARARGGSGRRDRVELLFPPVSGSQRADRECPGTGTWMVPSAPSLCAGELPGRRGVAMAVLDRAVRAPAACGGLGLRLSPVSS
ncbi:zinc finger CCHC domain-containing protein 2-like [Malurus melanocephalus]|uniref:zinc finger CCHC domain-containing protein 2-like n=1 Tax=Malurus melanocephalus TaxID=175006 RepID=UPI0025495C4C|nr:zinc finger CCHC domain-containing protein 2-like [Malurus melanocephalus]